MDFLFSSCTHEVSNEVNNVPQLGPQFLQILFEIIASTPRGNVQTAFKLVVFQPKQKLACPSVRGQPMCSASRRYIIEQH